MIEHLEAKSERKIKLQNAYEVSKNKRQEKKSANNLSELLPVLTDSLQALVERYKSNIASAEQIDQKVLLQLELLTALTHFDQVVDYFQNLPEEKRKAIPVIRHSSSKEEFKNRIKKENQKLILDIKSGESLKNDSFEAGSSWYHNWATVSGNEEALPDRIKHRATLSDKPYPSFSEMLGSTGGGIFALSNRISAKILAFAENYKR